MAQVGPWDLRPGGGGLCELSAGGLSVNLSWNHLKSGILRTCGSRQIETNLLSGGFLGNPARATTPTQGGTLFSSYMFFRNAVPLSTFLSTFPAIYCWFKEEMGNQPNLPLAPLEEQNISVAEECGLVPTNNPKGGSKTDVHSKTDGSSWGLCCFAAELLLVRRSKRPRSEFPLPRGNIWKGVTGPSKGTAPSNSIHAQPESGYMGSLYGCGAYPDGSFQLFSLGAPELNFTATKPFPQGPL